MEKSGIFATQSRWAILGAAATLLTVLALHFPTWPALPVGSFPTLTLCILVAPTDDRLIPDVEMCVGPKAIIVRQFGSKRPPLMTDIRTHVVGTSLLLRQKVAQANVVGGAGNA
ncbi:MAG: hypothetical protein V2I43_13630 [Parvularcula sp.]|jgi:hypothetical protein|nr:hypothetical protein [Parvularcula sp.]